MAITLLKEVGTENLSSGCGTVCKLTEKDWEKDFTTLKKNSNYIKTLKGFLAYKNIFHLGVIKSMYVDKLDRNKGLGKEILSYLIEESFNNGAKAVVLIADTLEENDIDLVKWYEKFGFQKYLTFESDCPTLILYK